MNREPLEPIGNRQHQIKNDRVKRALDFLESRVQNTKKEPASKPKSILRTNQHNNVLREDPLQRLHTNTNERPTHRDYIRKPYTPSFRHQKFDRTDTKLLNKPASSQPPREREAERVSILDRLELKEKHKRQEFRDHSPIRQIPELSKVPLSPLLKNSGVLKSQRLQQNDPISKTKKVTKPKRQSRVLGVLGSIGSKITNSLLRVDEIDDLIGRHNARVNSNPLSEPASINTSRGKDLTKPRSLDPNEYYFLV
ncbi:BA75_03772T0 [Komagataella pastoris]|uniref:BA75_03772T0 n=1 Tax=Komagataella pastoris TaxID=4922 RepID=A0A1B2JGG4_PICPA|nr:BA75_03772T0 [Komagataella pastoris]